MSFVKRAVSTINKWVGSLAPGAGGGDPAEMRFLPENEMLHTDARWGGLALPVPVRVPPGVSVGWVSLPTPAGLSRLLLTLL